MLYILFIFVKVKTLENSTAEYLYYNNWETYCEKVNIVIDGVLC